MTKKSTEIANIPSSEVQVIPNKEELQAGMRKTLKELDEKLKELGVSSVRTWKTGNYVLTEGGYNGTYSPITGTDVNQLFRMLGQVRRIKAEQYEIVKDLKLPKSTPCLIGGYKADDWIEDLEWKIKSLSNAQAVKDITAAKVKLEAFLSEDDRLIKTLSEIEKLMK